MVPLRWTTNIFLTRQIWDSMKLLHRRWKPLITTTETKQNRLIMKKKKTTTILNKIRFTPVSDKYHKMTTKPSFILNSTEKVNCVVTVTCSLCEKKENGRSRRKPKYNTRGKVNGCLFERMSLISYKSAYVLKRNHSITWCLKFVIFQYKLDFFIS